ncbi:MAG: GFA family protein [Pseudomonadota bacterium]
MPELKLPLNGGCQCGAVRYRITGQPLTLYACHCLDCQKQSSSAFGLSLWVDQDDFEIVQGTLNEWVTHGDSGEQKRCTFCGLCGSRIHHLSGDERSPFSVKGGTVDDPSVLEPIGHIWVKRAHDWLGLQESSKPCFETEPESFDGLIEAWRDR